jgi:hypothetical protein
MKIILSPTDSNKTTTVSLSGLVLTIDDVEYDLSVIPEGGQAEPEEDSHFIGIVTRESVTIKYEYDSLKAEPNQSTDWADYTFDIDEGEVPCPIKWLPEPEVLAPVVEPDQIDEDLIQSESENV